MTNFKRSPIPPPASQPDGIGPASDEEVGGRVFVYRWAGVKARKDCPSAAELLADGWEAEHIDDRYGSTLFRKACPE